MSNPPAVDIEELFNHANHKFGMSWNSANEILYGTLVEYKKHHHEYREETLGSISYEMKWDEASERSNIEALTPSTFRVLPANVQAWVICYTYMLEQNLEEMILLG